MTREDSMVIDEILAGQRWLVGFDVINAVRALRESNRAALCGRDSYSDGVSKLKLKLSEEIEKSSATLAAYAQKEAALKKAVEELNAADGRLLQAEIDLKKIQELLTDAVVEKSRFAAQAVQQGERAAKAEKELAELKNAVSGTLTGIVELGKEIQSFFGMSLEPTHGY